MTRTRTRDDPGGPIWKVSNNNMCRVEYMAVHNDIVSCLPTCAIASVGKRGVVTGLLNLRTI